MGRNRFRSGRLLGALGAPVRAFAATVSRMRTGLAPLLVLALLVAGGVVGYRAVIDSPYFVVRVVEVQPSAHLTRARIIELLGLTGPTSVFRFDETAATEALLAERWVAHATVTRKLPDRVTVHIEERDAAGVVVMGELFLVDDEGRPFVKPGRDEAQGLPLVTGLSRAEWSADQDAASARIRSALALARSYERSPVALKRRLSDVRLAPGGRMELMLGPMRVAMGSAGFGEKLIRLDAIDRSLRERNLDAAYVLLSDDLKRAIVMEKPLAQQKSASARAGAKGVF